MKYRRWNNKLRHIPLLKKKSGKYVQKREFALSDSSRGTSTQTIVNNIEQCKVETRDKDSELDSDRDSIHFNWSELIPITNEMNKTRDVAKTNTQPRKRAIKNIVLVPYKPKPKDWGSWKIKSPYVTSTIASPSLDINNQNKSQDQNNEEMVYVLHSPYYAPVHPPEFHEDA